jgi:uncharacterized membrane protein HdeD (DUF308 family)
MPAKLFLIRGTVAIVWAAAFIPVSDSITNATAALLVLYPAIDLVASASDPRHLQASAGRSLEINAYISWLAAVALGIVATVDPGNVLGVFGVWAAITGAAQFIVAIRRRAELGNQWPMLAAGALSAIGGVVFAITAAAHDTVHLGIVAFYAASGVLRDPGVAARPPSPPDCWFRCLRAGLNRRNRRDSATPTPGPVRLRGYGRSMPRTAPLAKYIRERPTAAARLPRVNASPRIEAPSFNVPIELMRRRPTVSATSMSRVVRSDQSRGREAISQRYDTPRPAGSKLRAAIVTASLCV